MMSGRLLSTLLLLVVVICASILQVTLGFETDQQELKAEADYGQKCSNETACIEGVGLECIYGTCSCLTGQGFEYDSGSKKCVGNFGSPCDGDDDCTTNSMCDDMFCTCSPGYSQTKSKHCKGDFGKKCTTNTDCNGDVHLTCGGSGTTKMCTCEDEDNLMYVESINHCAGRVNQSCDPFVDFYGFPTGRTGYRCIVDGTECVRQSSDDEDGPTYKCQCSSGFEVTVDRTCKTITTTTTTAPGGGGGAEGLQILSVFQILSISFILLTKYCNY